MEKESSVSTNYLHICLALWKYYCLFLWVEKKMIFFRRIKLKAYVAWHS